MFSVLIRRVACVLLAIACCGAFGASRPKNIAPTVALTSPAAGAAYTAPATVLLSAMAADADGSIAKVAFYRGSTLIGTATSAPFSFTWTNVAAGSYSLTAKATDNAGATTTSAAVAINVGTASLATTIAHPTPETEFAYNATQVYGNYSGPAGTRVYVNNVGKQTVFAEITGPTTWLVRSLPLDVGFNTITATTMRPDGTSSNASVVVNAIKRLVVLTSPLKNAVYEAPTSLTFEASTALSSGTIQRVHFIDSYGGTLATVTAPPWRYVKANPPKGNYSVYAAMDDGKVWTPSQTISFTVTGPNVPPTASLTAPAGGEKYGAPASVVLQATASDTDGTVARVEFLRDGQVVGSSNVAPYAMTVSNLPVGSYSFQARAVDDKGAAGLSAPVQVAVVENTPPTVSVSTDAKSTSLPAPANVVITAAAADAGAGLSKVEIYAGTHLLTTLNSAPFTYNWANVPAGDYAITAKAFNSLGGSGTSAPVNVKVSDEAGLLVDAGIDGSTVHGSRVMVTGRVAAPVNAGVTINGRIAAYDRRQGVFAAMVDLEPGPNAFKVVLGTEPGLYAIQDITITRAAMADGSPTISPASLEAEERGVITGQRGNYVLRVAEGVDFQGVELDLDGNGTTDFTLLASDMDEERAIHFYITYPMEGAWRMKATLRTAAGAVAGDAEAVTDVVKASTIDDISRGLWSTIDGALRAGDRAGAMLRLTSTARANYGPVYDVLMPDIAAIHATYSTPVTIGIRPSSSDFAIRRPDESGLEDVLLMFLKDGDGVWRLDMH